MIKIEDKLMFVRSQDGSWINLLQARQLNIFTSDENNDICSVKAIFDKHNDFQVHYLFTGTYDECKAQIEKHTNLVGDTDENTKRKAK